MKVKFTNFDREFRILKFELKKKFNAIAQKGQYVLGDELLIFEKKIEKFLKVKHVLGVGNWTEGTVMVLKALGYKNGDEVITVSNAFIATCGAISYAGLIPKLVDVGDNLNINVNLIQKKITNKTRAIMPVHLSGIPADLDELKKICKKYKLHLIEDAAHAFGTKYKNDYIGTIGDVGIFSLHPRKSFHVFGDGGLVVTNNTDLYKKILLMRNHGLKNREQSLIFGTNSRLDNLQAGFGNIMLKRIVAWNKIQLKISKKYSKNLNIFLKTPIYDSKISNPSFHQYIIRTKYRDELKKFLKRNNIETAIHYPIPVHQQYAYKKQFGKVFLPMTERFSKEILSLPINVYMTRKEIDYVIKKIQEFFKEKII
jgi:dTDP-4-amino-4,6-dideoxygalactose transaminase